jgi:hypothetical protein
LPLALLTLLHPIFDEIKYNKMNKIYNKIILLSIVLIFNFSLTTDCRTVNSSKMKSETSTKFYNSDSIPIFKLERMIDKLEIFTNRFSDSLNNYSADSLPQFLEVVDFDQYYSDFWPSNHNGLSIRKKIFDKVKNINCLNAILKSNKIIYRQIYKSTKYYHHATPYESYSNYDLAKLRIEEIKNLEYLQSSKYTKF